MICVAVVEWLLPLWIILRIVIRKLQWIRTSLLLVYMFVNYCRTMWFVVLQLKNRTSSRFYKDFFFNIVKFLSNSRSSDLVVTSFNGRLGCFIVLNLLVYVTSFFTTVRITISFGRYKWYLKLF